jgi:FMN-dependent NADH-azoreductase
MAKLLYIETSPRKKRSSSIAISNVFLDEYRKSHPQDEIITIDLWDRTLPQFDGDVIDAKYAIMHGKPHTPEQSRAWKAVEEVISEFKNADKYLISLPMWNFSIPYKLKQYIDVLVQPSYTFTITPEGEYKGLVTGKKIVMIYARGGAYGAETGALHLDLQKSYMETVLKFIGFQDISSIVIEPTLASPELKEKALAGAKEEALGLASRF